MTERKPRFELHTREQIHILASNTREPKLRRMRRKMEVSIMYVWMGLGVLVTISLCISILCLVGCALFSDSCY